MDLRSSLFVLVEILENKMPSVCMILIVTSPPEPGLVAPFRCTVKPLVRTPENVHPARIGGVCVINDAVLDREGAHSGRFSRVCCPVGASACSNFRKRS